jgi:hypothetical protein
MRIARLLLIFLALAVTNLRAQEFLDRVGDALSFQAFDNNLRARISGTLDLEYYWWEKPAPALIDAEGNSLFNPRLSLFLDGQAGPHVYFFAQARLDRGFDPTDEGAEVRMDEYALRVTPWEDGRLSVQIGKFAAVVGNWNPRHLSWDNPFITAPLVYENVTILEDEKALPASYIRAGELEDEKYEYLPVIWGPSYATGASVAGRIGKFEYAAEIKNASLSSRPESWDLTQVGFEHPTVNARVGLRPNEAWNFGVSGSKGAYFRPEAEPTLPAGRGIGDYEQLALAQDVSFAWRHLQIWAEFYQVRFELPDLGNADSFSYYLEAKYKFTPQLFGAIRWNQQFFDHVQEHHGPPFPWWHDISRVDTALIYRLTEHTQLKLQYNLQYEEDRSRYGHTFATQLTVRF